jgi:hypothetical protein
VGQAWTRYGNSDERKRLEVRRSFEGAKAFARDRAAIEVLVLVPFSLAVLPPWRAKTESLYRPVLRFASSPKSPICYNVDRAIRIQETTMELPIKFPSETEVILEDVARFRALSPAERVREIRGMLAIGAHLMKISPKAAWAREYAEEQELLAQRNIREFIARHGG